MVYNPSFHPFQDDEFQKVKIIRKPSPEKYIGPAANYLYDFICIRDAIKRKADIVLECGYATAVPALKILNFSTTKLLINPDGMEWQRQKFNSFVRRIIKRAENNMAKSGHKLVCDSPELVKYYKEKYNADSFYIPYGAEIFNNPDEKKLSDYKVKPFEYYLVIARFEPENNLRKIIQGFLMSRSKERLLLNEMLPDGELENNDGELPENKLLIISSTLNHYGHELFRKFSANPDILFTKDIFDQRILDNLRYYSRAYFHGHSAGGTNPSLLEAMSAGAFIVAHDNIFNRNILKDNALYFSNETDISKILLSENEWMHKKEAFVKANLNLIEKVYSWEDVADKYENLLKSLI